MSKKNTLNQIRGQADISELQLTLGRQYSRLLILDYPLLSETIFTNLSKNYYLLLTATLNTHKRFSRCWDIVQLAGRRVLVPLIKVRVLVSQPAKFLPASSW